MDRMLKAARSSGSLNLSNRSLREVPDEVYQILDAVREDEKWWEAAEMQKLILAHNNIEVLKEDVKNLSMLSVLNISHNRLSHLPAAIGDLPMLKSLDVSFNSILCIPEEIGSATALVKLDYSNNLLKDLPNSLGSCLDLSELKASNNSITRLPEDLVNCSKLMKLDMEGNKLAAIPENLLSSWTILSELNASKNLLTSIPESIGTLSRLIRLDFHQNRISSIPSSIMGCCSLKEFYMGNNMLSSLPAEIGALSLLGTLDLHSNQLKEYPVEACKLRLSVLDLSNNALSGLPPQIGLKKCSLVSGPTPTLLKYLRTRLPDAEGPESATSPMKEDQIAIATREALSSKELSLGGLALTAIPSAVWESGEILKVDLSRNSIQEIPNELSLCTSLESLNGKLSDECIDYLKVGMLISITFEQCCMDSISQADASVLDTHWVLILTNNKIKEWPGAVIQSLSNLSCLKLNNNLLQQIPSDGFRDLSKLKILDLSGNAASFKEHPPLSSLQQLQELYLRRMQLHEVPLDIMSLEQLRILDLGQNSLQTIPEGFKNLTSLVELDLSDNNITTLPPELGLLETSLQALRLDGNPLRSIRRAILDRGTKVVLKYLKDKIPEQ
ncbi:PREDICTED: plant intracellular Ras-group-related LRR protein 6 isoform X2 [Nelumbo nucifera]|uniref:Plant intracellular Ras-group-related LRR protein 6 isoform X2 n=1 Tax=Nelumbo nucifera TaxID=4432 RepID=A0A1U8PYB1_NELNU|nr:PREDICTED: plant intracellular Ras-group-related LRR protein 6 isoform X2 [Nelumbo nucifera]